MKRAIVIGSLCALAASGSARGDRYTRGEAIYRSTCSGCHTIGWREPQPRPGRVDLTRVTDRLRIAELARFLDSPQSVRPDASCVHQALGREQIDDLVFFFDMHGSDAPVRARVAPASKTVPAPPRSRRVSSPPAAARPPATAPPASAAPTARKRDRGAR